MRLYITRSHNAENPWYVQIYLPLLLDILSLRIELIKQLHTLLVHRKHNPSAHHQSRQSRHCSRPERPKPLFPKDPNTAVETVPVLLPRLDTLHASLDAVQRLCDVHRDEACGGAETEGGCRAELFAGGDVRLCELLQGVVGAEAGCGVGGLAHGCGHEALEEGAGAALAEDDAGSVDEASHAGIGAFAVVDSASVSIRILPAFPHVRAVCVRSELRVTHKLVLILSNGVTAITDSVIPAPSPHSTVFGPEMFPFSSLSRFLKKS